MYSPTKHDTLEWVKDAPHSHRHRLLDGVYVPFKHGWPRWQQDDEDGDCVLNRIKWQTTTTRSTY